LKVLGCDRKCESCPLMELCGGIEQYGVKGYRCSMAGCELKFPALKRMMECSACSVGRDNPPKVTVEWISEKVKELFPSVEWRGDLERIRRMLGRKKSE